MNLLCYFFGHTGDFHDGPYHVCSRCGCHAYYHSDAVDDPDYPSIYDKNAMFYRWFVWPVRDRWERYQSKRQWNRDRKDAGDLPF